MNRLYGELIRTSFWTFLFSSPFIDFRNRLYSQLERVNTERRLVNETIHLECILHGGVGVCVGGGGGGGVVRSVHLI